jgi:hypothetical protein
MLIFLSDGKPVNIVLHNLPIACALLRYGRKNLGSSLEQFGEITLGYRQT